MDQHGPTAVAVALLAASSLTACGRDAAPAAPRSDPPWILCGTTLWNAATGVTVTDATTPGRTVRVRSTTGDGSVIGLLASRDCDRGATIRMDAMAASLQGSVTATDGLAVAELVQPLRPRFTITVEHPHQRPTIVEVDLAGSVTPSG